MVNRSTRANLAPPNLLESNELQRAAPFEQKFWLARSVLNRSSATDSADHAEFAEEPETRNRSTRGALIGVLLGAAVWGAILLLSGAVKL
jgi:hypothetical protein